jgi:hypothetical protein
MRTGRRFALAAAVGGLVVAVPAAAKPSHPAHPSHPAQTSAPAHPSHPSTSHKCTPHKVAYTASGQLVMWAATPNAGGTFSGTITVHVTRANHHATGAKGTDVTYTLSNAKVTFGKGANPPATGARVKVIGKTTALAKKCDQTGFTPTITVRKVAVHAAAT